MDTSTGDITFDSNGICNYCTVFVEKIERDKEILANLQDHRDDFLDRVRADGRGKEYDCIVGLSGGVDSSYALYLSVENGLRPLAVHLDNGWNSELASHNIANLVDKLGVDLYTHVIDWDENRDMQRSFFKAHVVDIEILMDNAQAAVNYQQAKRYKLKNILSGTNTATEGIGYSKRFYQFKFDVRNIRSIHKKFGSIPIKTHPLISTVDWLFYEYVRGIRWINFLDYFDYNKSSAVETLTQEVDYKPYQYKHYESVFTRFYQGYILPKKFGFDKRRVHLSALIISGQMSRTEALSHFEKEPYHELNQLRIDREFVIKKLGFTSCEFDNYIKTPGVAHNNYNSEIWLINSLVKLKKTLNSLQK